ncbi:Ferritin and Dps [Rubrobacter xylanophilus DSM 9941]|uniref:Ferritin n=1 Tax=Rubrobacter xylanophilus (strain DSM 9941 / JCM 11954 / NBRC 16129 / PRD-1) TaxID=266117 RepID=Q1ASD6_RUBXD|nr:ferritin [Rubrobacter xylanophilus]ABG05692.1 Ferritin and Dps [Rubrobacter xylanophilus DSM 9941]
MTESAQTPMKTAVRDAIEEQVGREFYAAYLYLSMAGSFEVANLPGFAHWMREQSKEELEHAMKFFDFLLDRGERVQLPALDSPPAAFRSPLDAFEQALEHEKRVTASIHSIYDLAVREGDYPAQVLLNWFVEEQVEEEKVTSEAVERLRMAGEDNAAILMLDAEMGRR